ncbi:tRNA (adenosine(37)-N6)-threonylcarbamoyltransferase complex dimerization subunit type 1 TsaB [Chitinibacteraceae bacterium HSL-7]
MAFLALDTCSEYLTLALDHNGTVGTREILLGQRHAECTLPEIGELLAEMAVERQQIDAVIYGMGPGSFTGIRIGCGIAQGLAAGLSARLLGVSTLEALAQHVDHSHVYCCLDARMQQVYVAAYERTSDGWSESIAPTVCNPEDAPIPPSGNWVGAGSGFAAYSGVLNERLGSALARVDTQAHAHAQDMLNLARPRLARGEHIAPGDAPVLYVRDKVALKISERAK